MEPVYFSKGLWGSSETVSSPYSHTNALESLLCPCTVLGRAYCAVVTEGRSHYTALRCPAGCTDARCTTFGHISGRATGSISKSPSVVPFMGHDGHEHNGGLSGSHPQEHHKEEDEETANKKAVWWSEGCAHFHRRRKQVSKAHPPLEGLLCTDRGSWWSIRVT